MAIREHNEAARFLQMLLGPESVTAAIQSAVNKLDQRQRDVLRTFADSWVEDAVEHLGALNRVLARASETGEVSPSDQRRVLYLQSDVTDIIGVLQTVVAASEGAYAYLTTTPEKAAA